MPLCSVVIHSFNRGEHLERSLRALATADHDAIEVIVSDSGSTDGSRDIVRRKFPWVRLVELPEDRGLAAGRNAGIRIARGAYVLIMDEDVVVTEHQIMALARVMASHPEAGVLSCCKVDTSGRALYRHHVPVPSTLSLSFFIIMEWSIQEALRVLKATLRLGQERPHASEQIVEIPFIGGAFAMVRAEAIEQVGLLDEKIFFYGEDFDWWFRFRQKGWKILYLPQFHVQAHLGTNSRRTRCASLVAMQSRRYLFLKHVGQAYLPIYLLVALIGLVPRTAYYLIRRLCGRREEADIPIRHWLWSAVRIIVGTHPPVRLRDTCDGMVHVHG